MIVWVSREVPRLLELERRAFFEIASLDAGRAAQLGADAELAQLL